MFILQLCLIFWNVGGGGRGILFEDLIWRQLQNPLSFLSGNPPTQWHRYFVTQDHPQEELFLAKRLRENESGSASSLLQITCRLDASGPLAKNTAQDLGLDRRQKQFLNTYHNAGTILFSCDSNSLNPYEVGASIYYLPSWGKGKNSRNQECHTPKHLYRHSWAQENTLGDKPFCRLLQINTKIRLESTEYSSYSVSTLFLNQV